MPSKATWALILALLPGWIIPRIIGTIAALAASPTPIVILGLIGWWCVPPLGALLLLFLKRRYGDCLVSRIKKRYRSVAHL